MSLLFGLILLALSMFLTYYAAALGGAWHLVGEDDKKTKNFIVTLVNIFAVVIPLITLLSSHFLFR